MVGLGCGDDSGGPCRVAWRQRQEAERNGVDEANKWTGAVNRLSVDSFHPNYYICKLSSLSGFILYKWFCKFNVDFFGGFHFIFFKFGKHFIFSYFYLKNH